MLRISNVFAFEHSDVPVVSICVVFILYSFPLLFQEAGVKGRLRYAMLRYAALRYAMLRYATLR